MLSVNKPVSQLALRFFVKKIYKDEFEEFLLHKFYTAKRNC